MGPLHKHSTDIYLMFGSERKVLVPPDIDEQRKTKAVLIDFGSDKGSCGLELNLAESTNKVLI